MAIDVIEHGTGVAQHRLIKVNSEIVQGALTGSGHTVSDARRDSTGWMTFLEQTHKQKLGRMLYALALKRVIDVIFAIVALIVTAPVLILIALAVRLDSRGPAIFRQTRVGRGGQTFTVYKFRTMRVDPQGELRLFRGEDGKYRHKV